MDESHGGRSGPGSEGDEFRRLIERPTPELDSARLWRRIEAKLTRPSASARGIPVRTAWWPAPRLVWGVASLAVAALAVWLAFGGQEPAPLPQMVLLTPALPDSALAVPQQPAEGIASADGPGGAATGVPADAPLHLDVRLVRGYDGAPPGDVRAAEAMGVGGADALRDARASIEALLPFGSFGIVGAGRAELDDNATLEIALSADYRLITRFVDTGVPPGKTVRLAGVELVSRDQESLPADLYLEPGRLYVLGVLLADAENPELLLLIRAQSQQILGR